MAAVEASGGWEIQFLTHSSRISHLHSCCTFFEVTLFTFLDDLLCLVDTLYILLEFLELPVYYVAGVGVEVSRFFKGGPRIELLFVVVIFAAASWLLVLRV